MPRPVTPPHPHLRPRGPAPSPPHLGGAIPKAAAIRPAPSSLRPHNPRPLPRVGSCSPPSRTGPGVCESTHLHRRPPIRPPCGFFLLLLGPGSGEEKPPRRLPGGREGTARQAGGCGLVRGRAPPPLPRAGRQAGRQAVPPPRYCPLLLINSAKLGLGERSAQGCAARRGAATGWRCPPRAFHLLKALVKKNNVVLAGW